MEIFKEIAPLKAFLKAHRLRNKTIGLVPTMGALHQGHFSLVEASNAENDLTVCSIYVNPAQFNNASDLAKYPRTLQRDTESLAKVGCDILFTPENDEMYPVGSTLSLDFGKLDKVMEGRYRPGHFSGVALVVSKLFHIVQPHHAYFGQKDWQQFAVICRLVDELKFDLKLHNIPTHREENGLAMSSRNQRLSDEQRQKAAIFYKALSLAKELLLRGENVAEVKHSVQKLFGQHEDFRLEYFELADSKNLNLLDRVDAGDRPILCIAGYVGEVRLIDNMFLDLL
jgi:pantoate--beta-alanine ligase